MSASLSVVIMGIVCFDLINMIDFLKAINYGMGTYGEGGAAAQRGDAAADSVGQLDAKGTIDLLHSKGIVLSAQDQAKLLNQQADAASQRQMRDSMELNTFNAGLANNFSNARSQRDMALNAQKFAAENTANQLRELSANRSTNERLISNSLNAVSGWMR
jgi:hypothetical protein